MKHLYRTLMAITICLVLLAPLPDEADSLRDAAGRIDASLRQGSGQAATLPSATFTVNTDNDVDDGTCDATHCSLREAINAANASPDTDIIAFDITGPGPHPIEPLSPLPNITDPVIIDGTTEPDFAGTPVVELDGSHAGAGADGLHITAGDSTVRGLVIREFSGDAIELETNGGNAIEGNFLGTDFTGTLAGFGNATGVRVNNVPDNRIEEGNVISGNSGDGVVISGSSATVNVVRGNFIGTDKTGLQDLGNGGEGVFINGAPGNQIGGTAAGAGNVISGNGANGVRIEGSSATGNKIQGNFIGSDKNGTSALRNDTHGVFISSASNNLVGGTVSDAGNTIAFNRLHGVVVASGTGNGILSNSIFANGLAIDLGNDGPTPNDPLDVDSGANNLQNYPELTLVFVSAAGRTLIEGTLDSTPNATFRLEFFSSQDCGNPGGETLLGVAPVTIGGSGNISFTETLLVAVPLGHFVTATATDDQNNSSEFSACVEVVPLAKIGDLVWEDLNANGIQNVNEPGIANVQVNLLDTGLNHISTTTTDQQGLYRFFVAPGDYVIEVVRGQQADSFTLQDQVQDPEISDFVDSDVDPTTGRTGTVTVTTGQVDDTVDAGLFNYATIGGFVFDDKDKDGIQETGEPGVPGMTVRLLDNTATPPAQVAITTTNSGGLYSFASLNPGEYVVEFDLASTGFYSFTLRDQGTDDAVDSDADPVTGRTVTLTVTSGQTIDTVDAGLFNLATIGDFVFEDSLDGDGIQDAGESGISGVTVKLLDTALNTLDTKTTNINGNYSFEVEPGDYRVEFVNPGFGQFSPKDQGGDDTKDSDADPTTGRTVTVTVTSGQVKDTVDAGLYNEADLSLSKAGSPGMIKLGESITYTLTITNSGPQPATNVVLTDTLPAGAAFNPVNSTPGCSGTVSVVTCGLDTINNGGQATVTIVVTATQAGRLVNTADVRAREVDRTADNTGTEATIVQPIVNSTADPGNGICDLTQCTLREAINVTNSTVGIQEKIEFGISTSDPGYTTTTKTFRIQPASALPTITDPVIMDGFTQPGASPNTNPPGQASNAVLKIELDGSMAGPNTDGLVINAGNTSVRGLVINRFQGDGIELSTSGMNVIEGNYVGTDVSGTVNQGNGGHGVHLLNSSDNTVGRLATGASNIIAFNGGDGVYVESGTGNAIRANSIFTNTDLGIDLGPDGVTPNDVFKGDPDTGPNNLQNFPELTSIYRTDGVTTTVEGTFNSTPLTTFTIEFFASRALDASGYGEGQTFLGLTTVTTTVTGDAIFTTTLSASVSIFDKVTATATDPNGNTSEFSNGVGFIVVNATDDTNDGTCNAMHCSLREAITLANSRPDIKDSIVFNMPANDPNNRHFYYLNDVQPGQVSRANVTLTTAADDSTLSATIDPDHPHSWWSIQPNPGLPAVSAPAIIGGYTVVTDGVIQTLASPASETAPAVLRIELAGPNSNAGLNLGAGSTTVRGLALNRFTEGIRLERSNGSVVAGNYIGTDISGLVALGNGKGVLIWGANDNTIGGMTPQARNLISGQSQEGVSVAPEYAAGPSKGNVVRGNYIGTDVTGNKALPNGVGVVVGAPDNTIGPDNVISGNNWAGIEVRNARTVIQGNRIGTNAAGTASLANTGHGVYVVADDATIGGTAPGEGNVISGNGGAGVYSSGARTMIQGNLIGTDLTGTAPWGNGDVGVFIGGSQSTIGGTDVMARNVIAGNGKAGIHIQYAQDNDILGNLIGTNITGTAAIPNGGHGVYIGDVNNRVGGTANGAGNVISGNAGDGVAIIEDSNTVQGNMIGTAADGVSPLGNQGHGVSLLSGCLQGTGCADNNTIGGTASGAANTIAHNGGDGVSLSFAGPYLFDNDIRSNSIFSNTGLGIDLGDNGLTVNDPTDGDDGPNKLQNYPELDMVSLSAGQVTITYTVPSTTTHSAYPLTVEFFKADADGQEGQTFLGSDTYTTTEARRQKTVTFTPAVPVAQGDEIVATATDDDGNTSEFSPSRAPGVTVFIDDDFDDGDLATNTTGVGSGWSSGSNWYGSGGSETDSAFRFDGRSLNMGTLYEISSHENFKPGPGVVARFHSGNVEVISTYSDLDWRHQFAVVSANEPKSGSGGGGTNNEVNLYQNTEGGLYINIYYERETGTRDLSVSGDIRLANKNKVGSNSDDSIAGLFTPATFTFDSYDGQSELITTIIVNQSGWSVGFNKNISATLNAGGVTVAGNTIHGDWSSNSLDDAAITDEFDYGAYLFALGQNMWPAAGVGDVGRVFAAQDVDADGVGDDVEDGAPNNGDGNNDGIPDRQQENVTSLPNAADGGYVTLASPAGTELGDVSAVGNPSPGDAPPGVGFPLGFFDYTVQDITPGGSVTVTLFLTPGVTINTYYKFGPTPGNTTPHWYKFMFDGTTGAEIFVNRVILHFVDGLRGDDDLTANGKIVEPGSPALQPGADLTLSKSDAPDPVFVGQHLTYTLTIANHGSLDATGVTLTDTLPADVVYSSATPSQGSCAEAGGTVTCNLGALTTTDTMTVTLVVSPTAAVTLNNTAVVAANQFDPDVNNNSATISTTALIEYDRLPWWTVDDGGGEISGGGYSLYGTAGQPDAGALTGGDYTLAGGLWGAVAAPPPTCPGDLTYDNKVDVQDIMLAANGWRKQEGQPGYDPRVDRNGDKKITVDEIQWIAARWGTCELEP